jgi:tetratricopeptide (TPR) repeat protein
MFKAVGRFLQNVAGPRGTALVLDDLQWASLDGLQLLAYLVRGQIELPLRVLIALRNTEVQRDDSLAALLAELTRADKATRIELGPLANEQAEELLMRLLGETPREQAGAVTHVLHRAGGVPLYLVTYAQALRSSTPPSWGAGEAVPRDIVEGIRQRAAALSATGRDVLAVAALIGQRVPRALLMAIVAGHGHGESAILAALEDSCRARLLVEEGGDSYQFSHDLVREAILADLSMARRAALHRSVAEALERAPTPPPAAVLAYHYTRSGDLHCAIRYLERAGDQAFAMRANAVASHLYGELAAQLEALQRPKEAASAREKLGAALLTAAQYDAALDALEWAAETYRSDGDLEGSVRVLARIGEVHALRGSSEAGIARLDAWLAALGDVSLRPSAHGLARLYVSLAWLVNTTGQYAEALRTAERAVDLAGSADDAALLLQAKLRCGHLLLMLEQVDRGVAMLEEAIPIAEAQGDLRGLRFALNSLGWIQELRGNVERDAWYTARAFAVAEQLDDPTVLAFMRSNRGGPAFNRGAWREARADFEAGLAMSRQIGASWASAWPPLLLGRLCLAEGDQVRAQALLEEACTLSEHNQDLEAQRWAQGALAERDVLAGAPERALARLQPLLDRPGQQEIDVCALLPTLARAWCAVGQLERASAVATSALARARAADLQPTIADARHALAGVAASQGKWQAARADFEEALDIYHRLRLPYEEAKLRYALALFWRQRGRHERAATLLMEAREGLAQLGERLYAEQVETALRQRDDRP